MSTKLMSFVTLLLAMLLHQTQAIQLTSQSLVGNLLGEQTTLIALVFMMLILTILS
jgi:F0F1-type ATP synthase membrane subunit c/vacuolar-type H+-ATPase subunit K